MSKDKEQKPISEQLKTVDRFMKLANIPAGNRTQFLNESMKGGDLLKETKSPGKQETVAPKAKQDPDIKVKPGSNTKDEKWYMDGAKKGKPEKATSQGGKTLAPPAPKVAPAAKKAVMKEELEDDEDKDDVESPESEGPEDEGGEDVSFDSGGEDDSHEEPDGDETPIPDGESDEFGMSEPSPAGGVDQGAIKKVLQAFAQTMKEQFGIDMQIEDDGAGDLGAPEDDLGSSDSLGGDEVDSFGGDEVDSFGAGNEVAPPPSAADGKQLPPPNGAPAGLPDEDEKLDKMINEIVARVSRNVEKRLQERKRLEGMQRLRNLKNKGK